MGNSKSMKWLMMIVSSLLFLRVVMTLSNINPDINPMTYPKDLEDLPIMSSTAIPPLKIDHKAKDHEYEVHYYWTLISIGYHFQSLLADMLILLLIHIYIKTCYTLKFYRNIEFKQQRKAIVDKYTGRATSNGNSKFSKN